MFCPQLSSVSSGLTKFLSLQKCSYPRLYKEPRSWLFLSSNWNCLFTTSQSLHWFKSVYHYLKLLYLSLAHYFFLSLTKLEAFWGSYLFCSVSFLSFRNTIDTKKNDSEWNSPLILHMLWKMYWFPGPKPNMFLTYLICICVYLLIWWTTA